MLQNLVKYGNTYCGIEHTTNNDGNEVVNVLITAQKKSTLNIKKQDCFFNIDSVVSFLDTQKHIYLVINNASVITKKVAYTNDDEALILQQAFPNLKTSDFYVEVYKNKSDAFVTVCRKDVVDTLINEYKNKKITVIGFSLGNFSISTILDYVDDCIFTSNTKIYVKDSFIQNIEKNIQKENYSINGLELSNDFILSLSGILQGYFSDSNAKEKHQQTLVNVFLNERYLALGKVAGLVFLLLILLINFLCFSHYQTKLENIHTEIAFNKKYENEISLYRKRIANKDKLVNDLNSVLQSKVSFFINEISKTVPNTVLLTELSYQPLKATIRNDKEISYKNNEIVVKGIATKEEQLTQWIGSLDTHNWINEIVIQQFGVKKSDNNFEFIIKIAND